MQPPVDYDRVAPAYNRRYELGDYAVIERALLAFAGERRPQRVLEVGCGTGHWLQRLSTHGFEVAGVDASRGMLEGARKRIPTFHLVRAVAECLPFVEGSFDLVVCINALHHFPGKPAFFREARRVLKPEGGLLTVGLDPHTGLDRWYIYDYFERALQTDLQRYPSAASIRQCLMDAGFRDARTEVAEHLPSRREASEAWAQGVLEKSFTSQLSVMADAEYQRGLAAIRAAMDAAASRDELLELSADLRLYGTTARVG